MRILYAVLDLAYYRDTNQKEIDLVMEMDGQLHPFEIKRAASPDKRVIRTFSLLEKSGKDIGAGGTGCKLARYMIVMQGRNGRENN